MKVRGEAIYAIQRAFLVNRYFMDRTLISSQKYYPPFKQPVTNNCFVQVVTSNPISPWSEMIQGCVRILLEVRYYVYMKTPYFLPTEPVLFATHTVALTGVDARLMLLRHGGVKLVGWANRSYVPIVAEAGVKIYFYKARFNHSKPSVANDSLCMCGSTNTDSRNFGNNLGANIFFYDEELALRMKQVFLIDQESCVPADRPADFMRRSFLSRLWESLIRLLAPLL